MCVLQLPGMGCKPRLLGGERSLPSACILPRVPAIIVRTGLAYTNLVNFTDGTSWNFNRRERPHLIFAEGSRTIIALTNSAEPGGISGDRTFTLVQGVKRVE